MFSRYKVEHKEMFPLDIFTVKCFLFNLFSIGI